MRAVPSPTNILDFARRIELDCRDDVESHVPPEPAGSIDAIVRDHTWLGAACMSACNTRFLASLRSEVRNDLVSELGDPRASRMRSNSSSCLQRATANEAKCNSRVLGAETFGDFGLAVVLYEVGRDAANGTG